MRVLFLNPPFLKRYSRESRSPAVAKSGTLYYPMWLSYAAALIEKDGNEINLIDAAPENLSITEICKRLEGNKPDVIVVNTSTPSIYNDLKTGDILKERLGSSVILVGPHVTALPRETLAMSNTIDAVAKGSYDVIVRDFVRAIREKRDFSLVKGLLWRKDGEVVENAPAAELDSLDEIPFVTPIYKRFLKIQDYFYGHSRHPIIVITTGRGCKFKCTYCVLPQTMHKGEYRVRSIDNVVEEFKYIHENFPKVQEIMIEDDTLTVDRDRIRTLSQKLIDKGLNKIKWSANSRADVDYDTLAIMKKAGLRLLCVGFESGSQDILNNIKKGIKADRFAQFIKDAKKAGVMIHGCFMVGNWGDTKESMQRTLDLALEINPDTAQFYPIMVYPGTVDYDRYKSAGNIVSENFRDWLTEDGLHKSVVNIPGLSEKDLREFCDYARKKFYLRPKYILHKFMQSLKDPVEFKRNLFGARNLVKYIFRKPEA